MSEAIKYCTQQVREKAYAEYLCACFADTALRDRLLAMLALDIELASIPTKAREGMIASIRFAWWREHIEGQPGKRFQDGHPVLTALRETGADAEACLRILLSHAEAYPHSQPVPSVALGRLFESMPTGSGNAMWYKARSVAKRHHKKYGEVLPTWLAFKLLFLR